MSNTVQGVCTWVILPPTEKAVLNALADAADDNGVTWIAVKSRKEHKLDLMIKTGYGDRAIQGAIGRLVLAGHITRDERPGKGVITTIHPHGRIPKEWAKLAAAPPQQMRGAADAPPQETAETPAPGAGNPSVTINLGEAPARATVPDILALGVTQEAWDDYALMRKRKKAPLTPGAVDTGYKRLVALSAAGHPPNLVIEQSTFHAWTGFFELKESDHDIRSTGQARSDGTRNNLVGAATDAAGFGDDRPPAGPRDRG